MPVPEPQPRRPERERGKPSADAQARGAGSQQTQQFAEAQRRYEKMLATARGMQDLRDHQQPGLVREITDHQPAHTGQPKTDEQNLT